MSRIEILAMGVLGLLVIFFATITGTSLQHAEVWVPAFITAVCYLIAIIIGLLQMVVPKRA